MPVQQRQQRLELRPTERLEQRGLSLAAASSGIGRSPAFLHQFLNRWSPPPITEADLPY